MDLSCYCEYDNYTGKEGSESVLLLSFLIIESDDEIVPLSSER